MNYIPSYGLVSLLTLVLTVLKLDASALKLMQYTASSDLTRVAVNKTSGQVIIGGINLLVSLDKDLKNVVSKSVGPHFDSENCYKEPTPCSDSKPYTDNTVTILEINPVQDYILVCGSVWQGLCSIYQTSDFTVEKTFNSTNHAAFVGSKVSSIAFFGLRKYTVQDSIRLYAAVATYDRTKTEFSPPTISTRLLVNKEGDHHISYLKENSFQNENSYLTVSEADRKNFKVHYIYGFELEGYGYYVAIQPLDKDIARTNYVTKLLQFCQEDDRYRTYIEIPLVCHHNGVNYTLATAAYLGSDGMKDYLAVSFGRHGNRPTRDPDERYGTVVCNYSIETAKDELGLIRKRCSNGGAGTYPWWIYGSEQSCQIQTRVVSMTL